VICGLITATVMTTVVVPMLYRYFDPLPDVPDIDVTKVSPPTPSLAIPRLVIDESNG
jgi:heavy metal efflux system protein